MENELEAEVGRIRSMTMAELRQRYGDRFPDEFGTTHRLYLVRRIAWRLQATVYGGLSDAALIRASEIVDENGLRGQSQLVAEEDWAIRATQRKKARLKRDFRRPPAGSELTRIYRDRMINVQVSANGFLYEGRLYRSLSAIARAVTGTQWNGLIFFGLAKRREARAKKRPATRKILHAA
jgi:hypothetical protein